MKDHDAPITRRPALRIGIGGPVGSGKTALTLALCLALRDRYSLGVVTNDIYTAEDARFLVQHAALPQGAQGTSSTTLRHVTPPRTCLIAQNYHALPPLREWDHHAVTRPCPNVTPRTRDGGPGRACQDVRVHLSNLEVTCVHRHHTPGRGGASGRPAA